MNSYTYKHRLLLGGYTLLLFFTGAKADSLNIASVRGTVTSAITSGGLRKAYLLLTPAGGSGHSYSAVTTDQGAFTIENIAPGNYRLNAECTGFLGTEAVVELRLAAGQSLTGIEIKLTPQGTLSGRVLDQDGDPWPHANVNLFHSVWKKGRKKIEPANFEGFSEVDDRGEFRLSGLAPGRYYLLSEPDLGWEAQHHPDVNSEPAIRQQSTWYPASPDVLSSAPITLTAGQQLTGVEIRLRRSAGSKLRISGKLTGIQDIPAPQGDLRWTGRGISADGESHSYSGSIRPDGSFEISGVLSGAYEVWVRQGLPSTTILGHATVRVDDGDLDNVSIELHPPQTLQGTVSIEASGPAKPPRSSIYIENVDHPGIEPFIAQKDDGSFQVADLGLGRYRVLSSEPIRRQVYLKRLRYGNAESNDGTFTLSSYGVPLEVVLSTGGARLSGTVTGRAATSQVVLIPDTPDASRREYETRLGVFDQNEVFTIDSIPPGAYKLYAFENLPEEIWLDTDFLKEVESAGVGFQAVEGDSQRIQIPLLKKTQTDRVLAKLGIE